MRTIVKLLAAGVTAVLAAGCAGKGMPDVRAPLSERRTPAFERVHFAFGSDRLHNEARTVLDGHARRLLRRQDVFLVLEGHCDEIGGDAYNLELGDRRARRVKAYLMERGVDPDRLIMVVSYGERRPIDARHSADAWRRNRRVEFVIR